MELISEELISVVLKSLEELKKLSAEKWNSQSAPGKWTKQEILGHLIDSAANNHQRFVRVQLEDNPTISYSQNEWVSAESFNQEPVENLIVLWASYNIHLANILSNIPKEKLSNRCNIGKDAPVTLEFLSEDYLRHLKHHLNQILA